MGKGSKPRPVSKNYGNEYDRIFGKRCLKHHKVDCLQCSFEEHMLKPNDDPRTDHPNND